VFFEDGELLQRLASELLDRTRDDLVKEGWGWVETLLSYGQVDGCAGERLHPTQRKPKPAEKQAIDKLEARIDQLDAKLEDAGDDSPLWAERDKAETQLDALQQSLRVFDRKLVAHAGAVAALDRDGRVVITRGLIKRSDLRAIAKLQKVRGKSQT